MRTTVTIRQQLITKPKKWERIEDIMKDWFTPLQGWFRPLDPFPGIPLSIIVGAIFLLDSSSGIDNGDARRESFNRIN